MQYKAGFAAFLSHLSGDEALSELIHHSPNFLSHLSGDEDGDCTVQADYTFLSHLSGDEG